MEEKNQKKLSQRDESSSQKSSRTLHEEETLAFWEREKIFKQSLSKPSPEGEFIFYDGPPFANGAPHYGHLLASIIKDVIPRYKTMRGFHVPRRFGWDCHGLPVENLVEKELGLTSKKDIESFGIARFNIVAGLSVMRFADEWRKLIPRIGRWVDMEHDYRTMDSSYTESIWWAFKELSKKGLIYEGFKAMHLCPRCETTLSNFEVSQGYKNIEDLSVYVKFELIDDSISTDSGNAKTYILAWTTTPWTLPGNAALAVHPEIKYSLVHAETGKYILASSRIPAVFTGEKVKVEREFKGSELMGKNYIPPFDYYFKSDIKNRENGWKVYGAEFVTIEDGTGIVHIAPAFGEDDLKLGTESQLPFIQHVSVDGKFKHEVKDFPLRPVKPKDNHQEADIEIIKYLASKNLLLAKGKITHSYPHCWRCDTPLLNYAASSWFVRVTEVREKLIEANRQIHWIPSDIRDGRFGRWLSGARDWAISRSRFWGAPIPVWKCASCGKSEYLGSLSEMRARTKSTNRYLIVRHGEAENNMRGVVSANPAHPHHLTPHGRAQVEEVGKKIKHMGVDMIFASPFVRTRETAEIIRTALNLHPQFVKYDERIRELNAGLFDGKPIKNYQEFFSTSLERFSKTPPGGENYTMMRARLMDFIFDIEQRFQGKTILIVTHDSPAWILSAGAAGLSDAEAVSFRGEDDFFINNAEVKELSLWHFPHDGEFRLDFHRPYIDEVSFPCVCGALMKRIPDVFDCWFESGSMPFASVHYPFDTTSRFNPQGGFFKKQSGFPADFIAEGLDQTRGWFYSMLVLSIALFNESAYRSVIVNGIILAEDGQKMAKRLKNYPDPMEIIQRYGADALRYYFLASPVVSGEDIRFAENDVDEAGKKIIARLENVLSFYLLYADSKPPAGSSKLTASHVLDRWIIARLNVLINAVTKGLEEGELNRATRPIGGFIEDLSTWYLRRSRERFKEEGHDKVAALSTFRYVLFELSKVSAPFIPFLSEQLFQHTRLSRDVLSVHLASWPRAARADDKVLEDMEEVRKIVSCGLEARSKAKIKVRQPLGRLRIKNYESRITNKKELIQLIGDEVNIKEVVFDKTIKDEIELDTTITPELKEEGQLRELIRAIQDLRKKEGLEPRTLVVLDLETDATGKQFIEKNKGELVKATSLKDISFASVITEPFVIGTFSFKFKIKKQ